jgi:hypothetical protein
MSASAYELISSSSAPDYVVSMSPPPRQSTPMMSRPKGKQDPDESPQLPNEIRSENKSGTNRSTLRVKGSANIGPQDDDILIPSWTYTTSSGVVYNPIREKRVQTSKKNATRKPTDSTQVIITRSHLFDARYPSRKNTNLPIRLLRPPPAKRLHSSLEQSQESKHIIQ